MAEQGVESTVWDKRLVCWAIVFLVGGLAMLGWFIVVVTTGGSWFSLIYGFPIVIAAIWVPRLAGSWRCRITADENGVSRSGPLGWSLSHSEIASMALQRRSAVTYLVIWPSESFLASATTPTSEQFALAQVLREHSNPGAISRIGRWFFYGDTPRGTFSGPISSDAAEELQRLFAVPAHDR